jgi:hypothetical protein
MNPGDLVVWVSRTPVLYTPETPGVLDIRRASPSVRRTAKPCITVS